MERLGEVFLIFNKIVNKNFLLEVIDIAPISNWRHYSNIDHLFAMEFKRFDGVSKLLPGEFKFEIRNIRLNEFESH